MNIFTKLNSIATIIALLTAFQAEAASAEQSVTFTINQGVESGWDFTKYDWDNSSAYVLNSIYFDNDFNFRFSSTRDGANYSCLNVYAPTRYIRLRPINGVIPNYVTMDFSCPYTKKVTKITFNDIEERAFGVKGYECKPGSIETPSKMEFDWVADNETGYNTFTTVLASGANNGPSEFRIYSITITYIEDTEAKPEGLADIFNSQYPRKERVSQELDWISLSFIGELGFNKECEEKCTVSLNGEVIDSYAADQLRLEIAWCDRPVNPSTTDYEHESEAFTSLICEPSPAYDKSGTYIFTVPDNFLMYNGTPMKGISASFIVKNDTTGIESPENDSEVTVYSTTGILLMKNVPANQLYSLPAGLYIINGKKVML